MPNLLLLASLELVPSSSLKVKGKAGKRVLISLNTALDACVNISRDWASGVINIWQSTDPRLQYVFM